MSAMGVWLVVMGVSFGWGVILAYGWEGVVAGNPATGMVWVYDGSAAGDWGYFAGGVFAWFTGMGRVGECWGWGVSVRSPVF